MQLQANAGFRRCLERRTHSDVNSKMAAFHQLILGTKKKKEESDETYV